MHMPLASTFPLQEGTKLHLFFLLDSALKTFPTPAPTVQWYRIVDSGAALRPFGAPAASKTPFFVGVLFFV